MKWKWLSQHWLLYRAFGRMWASRHKLALESEVLQTFMVRSKCGVTRFLRAGMLPRAFNLLASQETLFTGSYHLGLAVITSSVPEAGGPSENNRLRKQTESKGRRGCRGKWGWHFTNEVVCFLVLPKSSPQTHQKNGTNAEGELGCALPERHLGPREVIRWGRTKG